MNRSVEKSDGSSLHWLHYPVIQQKVAEWRGNGFATVREWCNGSRDRPAKFQTAVSFAGGGLELAEDCEKKFAFRGMSYVVTWFGHNVDTTTARRK